MARSAGAPLMVVIRKGLALPASISQYTLYLAYLRIRRGYGRGVEA